MDYGIINYEDAGLTDVVFGDGRTGITSIGFPEGLGGVQLRRDGLEKEPFYSVGCPSEESISLLNDHSQHDTVRLIFDNKRSVDILIGLLEGCKMFIEDKTDED